MAHCFFMIFVTALLMSEGQSYGQDDDALINATYIADAVAKGAVCLDGSPGAYHYHVGVGDGVDKWIVYLPGGGWCNSRNDCVYRTKGYLGSTKHPQPTFRVILSSIQDTNPDFYDWNKIFIQYCDGASFMADVEAVDPETNLHLRGARIFRNTMEELLAKGMKKATNAILIGESAGGLATILNCDRFQALLPDVREVKCIADSAFFIHGKDLPGAKEREGYYATVIGFHGLAEILPRSCTARMDPNLCLFPENLIGDIQTPVFILNSAFDQYQIRYNNLHPETSDWRKCTLTHDLKNCTENQLQLIKDFRGSFLKTLKGVGNIPSRGMFINSCYIHGFLLKVGYWLQTPIIENTTISKAIGDWFFNRNSVRLIDTEADSPLNCFDSKAIFYLSILVFAFINL